MVNVRPKPDNLNDLVAIVVDIDNRQYERRKEKQNNRQGSTYTPSWTKNINNNRNYANQGRP
jgi:homogentisate 1,2-dioxygenase